jgi:F420-dependent oxidoreductase-like protein
MTALSWGIKTSPQHVTWESIVKVWQDAEGIDVIEHAWLFDHMAAIHGDVSGDCLEGWTALAALAAITKRLRLGLMVTGNTYRHPAVLAKIAATTDVISGGRLDLGIGAGWNEYEHESMGIPLYQPGERIRRLDEACDILKGLFQNETFSYDGRYYTLKEARCIPHPVQKPYPPIVIGGSGEKLTLKVVAKHADIWNYTGADVEEFKHKMNVLDEHCTAIGRNPADIVRSYQHRMKPGEYDWSVEDLKAYIDAGATHLVVILPQPYEDGIVQSAAEKIIAKVA